ncbi:MAG: hypothetical protein RBS16_00930 [Candidatus Cloacimonadales bacterium]|jgi:hypothetical protein|nr:hypothetical protein [Candidatus Cloacimonadota bacterium]MDD2651157.1 hypothetical protein [Candidatus Cloacimonadota bacterium]MDD3501808.1 hypothetical protein [Candidatus Cloacimonadota bacterium]MDX9976576.1 hypothetical protein [Candidatus Cloacimonadales bacterium]
MNPLFSFKDSHLGEVYIVIPKIREVSRGLGSIIITFDNGEKRKVDTNNQTELLGQITEAINNYYKSLK